MRNVLIAIFMGLVAGSAGAASFLSTPSAAIPDNDGPTNPVFDSIDTSATFSSGDLVTFVSIDLMIDHTWVGDLAVVLFSPSGTELQLAARPGSPIGDEQTGFPWGDSSNLSSANPITFIDGAATSAEDLGAGVGGGSDIPAGSYFPDADGWSTDIVNFAGFVGEPADGLWTIRVGDYGAGDTGILEAWNLVIMVIPEPSTGLLFGFGLVGLGRWQRNRALRAAHWSARHAVADPK